MLAEMRAVVAKIPKGKVATYGAVAKPPDFRATRAASRGRCAILMDDCHGIACWDAGGKILLPKQAGAEQRLRLQAEGVEFRGGRVYMEKHEFRFRARR